MNQEDIKKEEEIKKEAEEKAEESAEPKEENEPEYKEEKQHKEHKKKKPKSDKEQIEELQMKLNELNDRFLRLYAEFENYRKRALNERLELMKFASEDVIRDLLPIVDDYERGLKSMTETADVNSLKEGTELIYNKIKTLLEQKKVQEINAVGEAFNTDFHEAVTSIPAPSEDMKGKVIEQVQKGYTLNGKVIRYAKVVVGS